MRLPGPSDLNESLLRALPDIGPVVMVNLIRLRAGVSMDTYRRYARSVTTVVGNHGGTVLWAGTTEGVALGDTAKGFWDFIALVRYPSRDIFLGMMTSSEFAEVNIERERIVEEQIIMAANQTFPATATR